MVDDNPMKVFVDQLELQISDSITGDPIITSEEENFINYFINSPFLLPIFQTVRNYQTAKQITEAIVKKLSNLFAVSPLTEASARFASIYINVIMKCFEKNPEIDRNELFDMDILEKIISFSKQALTHANPPVVRMAYTKFAQMIGSFSDKVFTIFERQIVELIRRKPSSNEFKHEFVSFSRFISNKASVSYALQIFDTLYDDIFPNYKQEMCEIISQFIMQCYRITPSEFEDLEIDIPAAKTILNKLCSSKILLEPYKWEVFISLILLQHQNIDDKRYEVTFSMINKVILKKTHEHDQDKRYALASALYSALAVAETNGFGPYVSLFKKFKPTLLVIAKNNVQEITKLYPHIGYFMFADFPIALFYTDSTEFINVMFIYNAENTGVPRGIIARVIEHCSNNITTCEERKTINMSVVNIIESSSFDQQSSEALPIIFKAFEKDNKLFLDTIEFNPSLIIFMFGPYSKKGLSSLVNAFIATMSTYPNNEKQFTCFEYILSALTRRMDEFMLMKGDTLLTLSPILEYILRTARKYFTEDRDLFSMPRITAFVAQLEVISFCFIPTPLSPISLKILQFVIDITKEFGIEEFSKIPIKNYQKFIDTCNEGGKFDSSNVETFKPLLELGFENNMITNILCKHLGSLGHGLDPVAVDERVSSVSNVQSPSLMRMEFKDTLLLYCSLIRKLTNSFINTLNAVLRSGGYIGITASQCIPLILSPITYKQLSKAIYNEMCEIESSLNDVNPTFTANAMKLFQNLIESPKWTTSTISLALAEKIALAFTNYINMLVSAQRLAQCSEFLISFMTKYSTLISQKSRLEIATIIASWLARIDCGNSTVKAGASLCTALAKAVDRIPFSQEVYDDLMFIVSALNVRLEKQPAVHAEVSEAISAVFKLNFSLYSKSELARSLIGSDLTRAAYVLAAKEALCNNVEDKKSNIIPLLFDNDFELLLKVVECVPLKQYEDLSSELVKAVISRHVDDSFIEKMTDIEVAAANEATKNRIFRGNYISSRSVMNYTRIFGEEWRMTIYRPMVENVRKILQKGESVNIRTDRIPPNEDIEKNRATFRKFFIQAISIITAAIPKLPIQIIKMLQIIYKKVSVAYPELATMILNGILFLRFIIPTLTAPSEQEEVSEDERQCLVTLSIVLMAASLRGDLTDKGADYVMFNDLAALALDRFSASVNHIIGMDLTGAAAKWIEVDEDEVSDTISKILAKNAKQFNAIFDKTKKERPLTDNEEKLIAFVNKFIPPPPMTRAVRSIDKIFDSSSRDMREIINSKPDDREKELLDEFFFSDKSNRSDFDVFYLFAAKQPEGVDEKVIIGHILSTIASTPNDYYIIADFADYDPSRFQLPLSLKKLKQMIPQQIKSGLKEIYILRSSREFIEFYNAKKYVLSDDRMVFVTTEDDIDSDIKLSSILSKRVTEAILTEGSRQHTIINDYDVDIRVSKNSIHTTSYIEKVPVNDSILLSDIEKVSELTAPNETSLSFTLFMKDGTEFVFTTTPASGLYYLILSAFNRANREEIKYPQICTDSSDVNSSKWLLLLISFVGMLNGSCKYLEKTSYKLLEAVIEEYNFQVSIPNNVEESIDKCYEIMREVAESTPEAAGHFIVEAEKVMNLLKDPLPLFKLLQPWAPIIAKGYGGYPTLRYLIDITSSDEECKKVIKEGIWPALMSPTCIRRSLEVFFPISSPEMNDMLIQFAKVDKSITSEIAISELLQRRQNAPMNIMTLIENSCFDFESYGPQLVHATCLMRVATTSNEMLADLTIKALRTLISDADTSSLKAALLEEDDEIAAKAVANIVSDSADLRNALIDMFKGDLERNAKSFSAISSPEVFIQNLS